jgi:alpha-mannosidase
VRSTRKFRESTFTLTISLYAGVPRVDLGLEVDWLERGGPEIGVPALRAVFPVAVQGGVARFECPNGHVERPTDRASLVSHTHLYSPSGGRAAGVLDVPAQKWVDLTGRRRGRSEPVGLTVLNDSIYGHRVEGSTIRLTLLRSSYEPDPLPELGRHSIRLGLVPHVGEWSVSEATRAGYEFNLRCNAVATTAQQGSLPARKGFAEVLTPNIMLSGMKKAEDSDAVILRLYEMEGQAVRARIALDGALVPANAPACETDLLERPLTSNTALMENGMLSVSVPAFGLVTVRIG